MKKQQPPAKCWINFLLFLANDRIVRLDNYDLRHGNKEQLIIKLRDKDPGEETLFGILRNPTEKFLAAKKVSIYCPLPILKAILCSIIISLVSFLFFQLPSPDLVLGFCGKCIGDLRLRDWKSHFNRSRHIKNDIHKKEKPNLQCQFCGHPSDRWVYFTHFVKDSKLDADVIVVFIWKFQKRQEPVTHVQYVSKLVERTKKCQGIQISRWKSSDQ